MSLLRVSSTKVQLDYKDAGIVYTHFAEHLVPIEVLTFMLDHSYFMIDVSYCSLPFTTLVVPCIII